MSLKLYDFQCPKGHIHESIADTDTPSRQCPYCKGIAKRIISFGRVFLGNQDAAWLKTVHKVIDKRPGKQGPATREFLKNPTRANHKAWMRENKIVPLEPGEENERPSVPEVSTKALAERYMARHRIEVRSR